MMMSSLRNGDGLVGSRLNLFAILESSGCNSVEQLLRRIALFLGLLLTAALLTFCFVASSFCITVVASTFLAILVDPLVIRLEALRLTRPLAAATIVFCGMVLAGLLAYPIYHQTNSFVEQLPAYSYRIRQALDPIVRKVERLQTDAELITPRDAAHKIPEVKVKETPAWPSYLVRGVGSISNVLLIVAVVPFLTFFMLAKKNDMNARFTAMVGKRMDPQKFLCQLDRMIRGFVVGNLIVGSVMAGATSVTFALVGMKNPVALGVVTGLLNLIPFLGLILAMGMGSVAALAQFDTLGPFVVILVTILLLHVIAANMLVPRLIGSRVSVGPVAVTVGMLFWGWLWGVFGLLLAVPLTASVKLVTDSMFTFAASNHAESEGEESGYSCAMATE